jgi:hypothetical protein
MALQHLRSSTANKRPTPAVMSDGQLAMNTNLASPGLFLKDSNGDLVKIGPVHVGTTAPNATPGAGGQAGNSKGEQWLDTTGGVYVFKIYDGTAWRSETGTFVDVNGDTMTGALGIIAGSAASPGLFFSGDTNSGLYSPGADQVAVATNGTGRLVIDANGTVTCTSAQPTDGSIRISNTTTRAPGNKYGIRFADSASETNAAIYAEQASSGNNASALVFGTNDGTGGGVLTSAAERLRITSAGLVGIGNSAPNYQLHVTTDFAVGASGFNQQLTFSNDTIQSLLLGTGYTALKLNPLGGNVGIGTSSPNALLDVRSATAWVGDGTTDAFLQFNQSATAANRWHIGAGSANAFIFYKGTYGTGVETARIDSSGRLLVGTSSARSNFFNLSLYSPGIQLEGATDQGRIASIVGSAATGAGGILILGSQKSGAVGGNTAVTNGGELGIVSFQGNDGTEFVEAASIAAYVDGTPGANDMPGRIVLATTADGASSPTERMRINNAGNLLVGRTGTDGAALIQAPASSTVPSYGSATGVSTAITHFEFRNSNGLVGTISTNASATAYNTSSDYRLKENVSPVSDGIVRLQQLKPSRFNFIADSDQTVDGFIAHEVQAVVPECVTGEKDAVDDDGNPIYQGIDQSKLVPLLTAALQEAVARIEQLEAAVTALQQ